MNSFRKRSILAALLTPACALALFAGCSEDGGMKSTAGGKSLYERLGGEPAITAVVDDFVARAAPNPKINFTRKGTPAEWKATPENVAHLKKMLVQLVASATGGSQKYQGRDLKFVHRGMRITDAEFDALAADLKATLDKFNVPAREQDELISIIAASRKDVVEVPMATARG